MVDGYVRRNNPIRVLRDNVVIFEGELESLKRFKDDAGESSCRHRVRHRRQGLQRHQGQGPDRVLRAHRRGPPARHLRRGRCRASIRGRRRVEEQLKRLLSEARTPRESKDPRVGLITITSAEVTKDLTHANIYFTPFAGVGTKSCTRGAAPRGRIPAHPGEEPDAPSRRAELDFQHR